MLEINAIYLILLAEGFVLLLILMLAWILFSLVSKRRKQRQITQLAAGIRKRAQARREQTRAFLQTVYHFEDEDMQVALAEIDRHESEFMQHLVESLRRGGRVPMAALDTALEALLQSYKCMQPRVRLDLPETGEDEQEITLLQGENETLRSELSVAQNKLEDLVAEFGEIFGGGKDHQLTLQEVIDKVDALKAVQDPGDLRQA